MSRISGKPNSSPRVSWCFATCWKFDQIAGSPSTRVCTLELVWTNSCRNRLASSIAFELRLLDATGTSAAVPCAKSTGLPGCSACSRRRAGVSSASRFCTARGLSPVTKNVNEGGVTPGKRSSKRATASD